MASPVVAALLGAGKMGGLEPFAVLLVSLLSSKILYSNVFGRTEDDLQVEANEANLFGRC